MTPTCKKSPVTFVWCVGSAFFFHFASVTADEGKLFALVPSNGSQRLDFAMAQQSCAAAGARLAKAEELRRAVQYCYFAVCTRGWLVDGTVGTILCNRTENKPQSVKVIDVHIEMEPSPNGRYNALCVKVKGKPCGDPPSFPHTVLHGHTGLEMGDELHYVCAQGYVMGNRDTAFTLLCHTCGEWFGQVQVCVKDETEGHIDYEDNFPDDLALLIEGHNIKEAREKEHNAEEVRDDGSKTQLVDDNNHIGMKAFYNEKGTKMIYKGEDFPIGPILVNNDTKAAKSTVSNTDDSWLDGYPVTQEAVEEHDDEGDKIDGSIGMEDASTSGQPNHVSARKVSPSSVEKDFTQTEAVPRLMHDDGIKGTSVMLLRPTSTPENVTVSKGSDNNTIKYIPTTPVAFVAQELALVTTVTSLNLVTLKSSTVLHLSDHIPLPEEETAISPKQEATATIMPSQSDFTEPSADNLIEQDTFTYALRGKPLTTLEPCVGIHCSSSDKGRMIAVGVTVLCLLLLAAILGLCFFTKRQQKTSVYKLNGKYQTRYQLQQIEMQKV